MPIVVEHQPAFAAPGMMAAQTGQLEYRNKRRRELEQLAMQQAEMAQRQRISNNNIVAGFQKQQIAHQMNLQNNALQWQRGMIDDEAHHNRQKELVDINQQNQLKIAQANAQKEEEERKRQAIQDEEQRRAQIKADAEASTMAMLTPAGQENRNNIHAEWAETEATLIEENAPPEAIAQAREQYEQRLKDNRNNPQYIKPVDTHYPATTEHWTSPNEHTIYDNDGNATTQWAGKKRNPKYNPAHHEGTGNLAGLAVDENGELILEAGPRGLPNPVKYESEFLPQTREEYLYEKREWRGSEEDGTRSYREGALDEHGNYKPGTKWINVAEEEAEAIEAKIKRDYMQTLADWYALPPNLRGEQPKDPFAKEPTEWRPFGPEGGVPADDAVFRHGEDDAGENFKPLDNAFNAYPELAGSMAGNMGMEESMLTMGITPQTAGNPDAVQLSPEQIEVRAQFDRPDALPRMEPKEWGYNDFVRKLRVDEYDTVVKRPDGTQGAVPLYAVAPEDRQAVYEQRKNKPYVVKWPAKAEFNQQNLANVILSKDNPIMFGTVIDLSKITSESGKAFAKAWEERTGSPNFVFERELILNIGRKAYRGQEYQDFENKVIQQEKEHYEFYGFPGDFQSQSQQGGALGRILQAGGAR
jgi:hypothetical protein